jgi:Zn finger protein HypA/HybF involved in hydrogenase expression
MGMFDTIQFAKPMKCPVCGEGCASTQTKEFARALAVYRVGSMLSGSAVHSGIIKETAWCEVCRKAKRDSRTAVPD